MATVRPILHNYQVNQIAATLATQGYTPLMLIKLKICPTNALSIYKHLSSTPKSTLQLCTDFIDMWGNFSATPAQSLNGPIVLNSYSSSTKNKTRYDNFDLSVFNQADLNTLTIKNNYLSFQDCDVVCSPIVPEKPSITGALFITINTKNTAAPYHSATSVISNLL